MARINSYRDLRVWQASVELAVRMYAVSSEFPQSELYGLTSQSRRAAVSIASNIAEGHARSTKEYARFLRVARGSLAELETQLEIARRVNFLSEDAHRTMLHETSALGRQLNALLGQLNARSGA